MRHRAQKSTTGPERRKERETFCVRFGKWTRFLRWRTQLHENDSHCESFFNLYRLIRCSRITSDEENVNKLLCDARSWVRIFWEAKLHSAKFRACELEFNYTKPTHPVSRFYLYILYIQPPNHSHCEWFPQCLLDVIESRVMKRTSISYCAMWEKSRADIPGSKTSQCEVLVLR